MGGTTRIETGPISGSERQGFLSAGYVEIRSSPDPDVGPPGDVWRVVDVGPDWIDVERDWNGPIVDPNGVVLD